MNIHRPGCLTSAQYCLFIDIYFGYWLVYPQCTFLCQTWKVFSNYPHYSLLFFALGWSILTALNIGCNRVKHMTMDSMRTRSWNDSRALISIFNICFTSESVAVLLIQPNTMIALGWRAGLYWNANLKKTDIIFTRKKNMTIIHLLMAHFWM